MKVFLDADCPQGSAIWHSVRLGIPTASNAHKFITKAKGDLSEQRHKYGHQLIAERLLNETFATDIGHLPWIIEGKEREDEAAKAYAEIMGTETVKVGFISDDNHRYGCSPDRLVLVDGVRGAVEIKVPTEPVHIGYMIENGPGDDYRPQIAMQLFVAELEWADFFSHNPRCPPFRRRSVPDLAYQKKLAENLMRFCDELDATEERVRKLGLYSPAPKIASDADRLADAAVAKALAGDISDEDEIMNLALGTMRPEHRERVRSGRDVFQ